MGFKKTLDSILAHLLVLLMGLMVLNVLWQVFSRYVLGEPSAFTDELARFLMIWLGLLGAAYVSGKKGHVAIDVLAKRASVKNQKWLKGRVQLYYTVLLGRNGNRRWMVGLYHL